MQDILYKDLIKVIEDFKNVLEKFNKLKEKQEIIPISDCFWECQITRRIDSDGTGAQIYYIAQTESEPLLKTTAFISGLYNTRSEAEAVWKRFAWLNGIVNWKFKYAD